MTDQNQETLTTFPNGSSYSEQPQWRKDFPIDVQQDNYVARRDFVKFLVLTSFAFTTGQFWILVQSLFKNYHNIIPIKKIGLVDQIKVGGVLSFSYPEEHNKCLLLRTSENTFLAYSQECTHLSCAVIPEIEKGRLYCPCHEGVFDLTTGNPIAGPPRRPLPRINIEVHQGEIYATNYRG